MGLSSVLLLLLVVVIAVDDVDGREFRYRMKVKGSCSKRLTEAQCKAIATKAATPFSARRSTYNPRGCYYNKGRKKYYYNGRQSQGKCSDSKRCMCQDLSRNRKLTDHKAVSCGHHRASSCAGCTQGHGAGWCNGDCSWETAKGGRCVSVDPCKNNKGGCEHKCKNVGGKAQCSCKDGFELVDGKKCKQATTRTAKPQEATFKENLGTWILTYGTPDEVTGTYGTNPKLTLALNGGKYTLNGAPVKMFVSQWKGEKGWFYFVVTRRFTRDLISTSYFIRISGSGKSIIDTFKITDEKDVVKGTFKKLEVYVETNSGRCAASTVTEDQCKKIANEKEGVKFATILNPYRFAFPPGCYLKQRTNTMYFNIAHDKFPCTYKRVCYCLKGAKGNDEQENVLADQKGDHDAEKEKEEEEEEEDGKYAPKYVLDTPQDARKDVLDEIQDTPQDSRKDVLLDEFKDF